MSTLIGPTSVASSNTMPLWASWATFISKAFLAFGWKQATDTGQMQWPTSTTVLTQVAVSGGNAVYTYDATQFYGAALVVGMPISVVGFSTGGNNVTNQLITALGGSGVSSTFTVATTTQVNETHAAAAAVGVAVNVSAVAVSGGNAVYTYNAAAISGGISALRVGFPVQVSGFATGGNNVSNRVITALGGSGASSTFTVAATTQVNETHAALCIINPVNFTTAGIPSAVGNYEIFQSQDALSATAPITVRIDHGSSGAGVPKFWVQFGTNGTNGVGGLGSPSTINGNHGTSIFGADAVVMRNNYASGDAGNIRMLLLTGPPTSPNYYQFMCISRSYDVNGNQTNQYVQLWTSAYGANSQQTIFSLPGGGGTPQPEFANWIGCVGQTSGQTQGYAGIVAVTPCYQIVGGFSNPSPDLAVGKNADFPDGVTVNVTFYNVNHTYFVSNASRPYVIGTAGALLMRFE